MELKHLRVLVTAIEEGSIQAASRELKIAQPALSRRIRDLEMSLGCELLVRGGRGVVPTPAGLALYHDALAILGSVVEAGQHARRVGLDQDREMRLGLVQSARKYGFIREALADFNKRYPQSGVALMRAVSRDLVAAIRDDRLDATILYEQRVASERMAGRLIHKERYVLAAHPTHRLAKSRPASLSELAGEPLVCMLRNDTVDQHNPLLQHCRLHGLEPVVGHWANSPDELMDMVMVIGGVCITPASSILFMPEGQLVFRALPDFSLELDLSLAWSVGSGTVQSTAFLAALHRAIDGHQNEILKSKAGWAILNGLRLYRVEEDAKD
jgi:DNA-binding transcriptional LysR family regulator